MVDCQIRRIRMINIAFYDTKPYDKIWFDRLKGDYNVEFKYFENKLNSDTAVMAKGAENAERIAYKTLRKVYKKVGFTER